MKKVIQILVGVGCICFLAGNVVAESVTLSASEEAMYQSAWRDWRRVSAAFADAGIPVIPPPERQDFAGRALSNLAAQARREETAAQWAAKRASIEPTLRDVVPPASNDRTRTDKRFIAAQTRKQRMLAAAEEKAATQPAIEASLDTLAAKYGVNRREPIGDGRQAELSGEVDGHLLWTVGFDIVSSAGISADRLWPTNLTFQPALSTELDLTGDEVVLGMWEVDGGVRESHYEFHPRVIQVDDATNAHYHAMAVAGIMAGGGVLPFQVTGYPVHGAVLRGVAPGSFVDAYDRKDFALEIAEAVAGGEEYPGLRLSNHSYGMGAGWYPSGTEWLWYGSTNALRDPQFGWYSPSVPAGTECADMDILMAEEAPQHLLVFSAGNSRGVGPGAPTNYWVQMGTNGWVAVPNPSSGSKQWINGDGATYRFDTIPPRGTAKNVLTVGSVMDVFTISGGIPQIGFATNALVFSSPFSSAGPTDDGRIKPDVVAIGQGYSELRSTGIIGPSATSDTGIIGNLTGTSFSAPAVTAGFALMLQHRAQLFSNLVSEVDDWRGSTLKALAIHTADDIAPAGPDYLTGWGMFNAVSLVRQVELEAAHGRGTHIREFLVDVDETLSWQVDCDGSEPLKVTIAWSDPPGNPPTNMIVLDDPTPMLVNNLDVAVQKDAQTWMPWILNPDLTNRSEAARAAPATTGYDARNNVEQVFIADPSPGRYTLTVSHAGGTTNGITPSPQWVSVITSGDIPLAPKWKMVEAAPNDAVLLTFESDPGAYFDVEATSNLCEPQTWSPLGEIWAGSITNYLLHSANTNILFLRLSRQTQ